MSDSLNRCLARLRNDYARVTGTAFKHFFCPILWTDANAKLCMGHVVNKAYCGKKIVQRKDVDGFYGSIAEANFQDFLRCRGKSFKETISDPNLSKAIQLTVEGKKVDYYLDVGQRVPRHHTRVQIEGLDGDAVTVVVKMPPKDAAAIQNAAFGIAWDCMAPALASLIKAAHLTMFYLMGYRYAFSAASQYLGYGTQDVLPPKPREA